MSAFDDAMNAKADEAAGSGALGSEGAAPPSYDGAPTPGSAAATPPTYAAATNEEKGPARYTAASASQHCVYLVRSDGVVDRSTRNGAVSNRMEPDAPHTYVAVSAGHHASYLLRSDGVVVRTKGSGKTDGVRSEIRPPPQVRYVAVGAGPHASYLVRSDGKIDRTVRNGQVERELAPVGWPAVKYTAAAGGFDRTYLVRDDGAVDAIKSGALKNTIVPAAGTRYLSVSDQLTIQSDKAAWGNMASYLVRDDGAVIRVVNSNSNGDVNREYPPPATGVTYVASSAGDSASYLVRSDGKVDRIRGMDGHIEQTLDGTKRSSGAADESTKALQYVGVSAGVSACYLVRGDGAVDRSKRNGEISELMIPPTKEQFERGGGGGCSLM